MELTILNGLTTTNHNEEFHPAPDPYDLFDKTHGYAHMGVSALGFYNEQRWRVEAKEHQRRWWHTAMPGWFGRWAKWFDTADWLGRSGDFDGCKRITLMIDNESLQPHVYYWKDHPDFFNDKGQITLAGRWYNRLAPQAMSKITPYIAYRAQERWPGKKIRVCHTSLVWRPAITADEPDRPRKQALDVFYSVPKNYRALNLKLRFMREDRPRNLAESIAWSSMALSARHDFADPETNEDPPTIAEHYWRVFDTALPTTEQVAGAMVACARAGVPFVPGGGSGPETIQKAGLTYEGYMAHLRAAKRLALETLEREAA